MLRQFCLAPKKSLGERIQNQLRDCKYPDKKLRYPRLQLFSHFLCTTKYENLAESALKKCSATIDRTHEKTHENILVSVEIFQVSRQMTDFCQFLVLSKVSTYR